MAIDMGHARLVSAPALAALVLAGGSPAPVRAGCATCDLLYASDCNFGLWAIDPAAGTSTLVGITPDILFDVAFTADQTLFGLDSSNRLWQVDSCDASASVVASVGGNGLGGEPATMLLYAQGPPLTRTDAGAGFPTTVVGGVLGPTPPEWCGLSSGDLTLDRTSGLFYSTLACFGCSGDTLVTVTPATGEVAAVVGCLVDALGQPLLDVHGLAFDSQGTLWGAQAVIGAHILRIDPATAVATRVPIAGGYTCAFGLAALACDCGGPDPLPPDQGNVVRGIRQGSDVLLDFAGAPATRWRVYRDPDKTQLGFTALAPDVTSPSFLDAGAVAPPPTLWLYRVKGLSPCTGRPGP